MSRSTMFTLACSIGAPLVIVWVVAIAMADHEVAEMFAAVLLWLVIGGCTSCRPSLRRWDIHGSRQR